MQKLSVEVLEKMLGADLSNHEIDMMLYIARFSRRVRTYPGRVLQRYL